MNIESQIPAVCENKDCENYRGFELYDIDEVKAPQGESYIICYYCKEKIFIK